MPGSRRLQGLRILVVDDNEDARELMHLALANDGAEVLSAENGAEAIPIMYRERPNVVITDLSMPLMDGYEVLKATRDLLPRAPCIAVSAMLVQEDGRAALDGDFDARIGKPVDYDAFIDRIVAATSRRPARSGEMLRPHVDRTRRKKAR